MCRSSCCDNNSGGQGTGIAAMAIIIVGAALAAKLTPTVARAVHAVGEVLRIAALTTAALAIGVALAWLTIAIARWWLRHQTAKPRGVVARVTAVSWEDGSEEGERPDCLACGGTGTVLRAITGGRYQPCACPACEPVRQAR